MRTMAVLSEAKYLLDDSSGITPMEMGAKARRLKAEHGLDLIIIDYLQLMRMKGRYDNRQQEINAISRSLKESGKRIECTCDRAFPAASRTGNTRKGSSPDAFRSS